jgi:hypothetical protein
MGCASPVIASTWRPLLAGELADRAWQAVSVLGERLAGDGTRPSAPSGGQPTDPTLATGDAGIALFLAHLSGTRADAAGHLADAARHRCGRMLAGAPRAQFRPGLFSGLLGVAWTLGQRAENSIDLDCDYEDSAATIDRALRRILRRERQPWHYDLSGGLAGVGVYALERMPRPVARDCAALVGEHLRRASERHPPGRAWRTPPELMPDADRGAGCFNLGMAHGIPAVLALLAAIAGGEADAGGMSQLLAEGVGWLLAQELPPEAASRFPALIGCGDAARNSPLAWCQGDLGLAAALLAIARRLGNEAWERAAVRIALAAAGREPDPAHQRKHPKLRWQRGFLNGDAGTGLALLAGVSPDEPRWDHVLLVSLPGPSGAEAASC